MQDCAREAQEIFRRRFMAGLRNMATQLTPYFGVDELKQSFARIMGFSLDNLEIVATGDEALERRFHEYAGPCAEASQYRERCVLRRPS